MSLSAPMRPVFGALAGFSTLFVSSWLAEGLTLCLVISKMGATRSAWNNNDHIEKNY